jgi:hypothetical protein
MAYWWFTIMFPWQIHNDIGNTTYRQPGCQAFAGFEQHRLPSQVANING